MIKKSKSPPVNILILALMLGQVMEAASNYTEIHCDSVCVFVRCWPPSRRQLLISQSKLRSSTVFSVHLTSRCVPDHPSLNPTPIHQINPRPHPALSQTRPPTRPCCGATIRWPRWTTARCFPSSRHGMGSKHSGWCVWRKGRSRW